MKKNMGIGLSVCQTIVKAHGGRITAENRPEGGAQFRFYLPLKEEKERMKIRDKVLIVEDEQNIKNFMSTILAANGFDTLMAGSAKEALSMISSHCPDLIILDLGLPDMDGMEVLKQVRLVECAGHRGLRAYARGRQGRGARSRRGRLHRKALRDE